MPAAYLEPRTLDQGTSYSETLNINDSEGAPVNFSTGYTALFQIRAGTADSGATALVSATHSTGVVLGNGTVDILLSPSTTRTAVSSTTAAKLYAELDITKTSTGEVSSYRWKLLVNREYARA